MARAVLLGFLEQLQFCGIDAPVIARIRWWSERVLALQSGSVHAYLTYLVVALLLLLGWLVVTGK